MRGWAASTVPEILKPLCRGLLLTLRFKGPVSQGQVESPGR